jgi:hypothetical protein
MFRIPDKNGRDVDFRLNPAQVEIDTTLTGRDIYPKARQRGVSTYFLARFLAKCLSRRNTRAVVISHDKESTQRLLSRVHYMLNNIKGPKAVIKNMSKNEITFPKTGSMFYLGTAGARSFGRGDTITDLHCSEVAYWPDAPTLMTGLLQAVPMNGEIAIESTGNGQGDWYHRTCTRAMQKLGRFVAHFLGWLEEPEYNLPVTPEEEMFILNNLSDLIEEREYIRESPNITAGQLKFRRQKLEELDYDLFRFKQEYPRTFDECFQSTGSSLFGNVIYRPTELWKRSDIDPHLHILEGHPNRRSFYSLGADVSAGVGRDFSTMEIIELGSMEQVGEYVNNRIEPDIFARKIYNVGLMFNEAFATVENNNHGIVTLKVLRDDLRYPIGKLYTRHTSSDDQIGRLTSLGARTTSISKPFYIGKLRKYLKEFITVHSPILKGELNTFIETETGRLEAKQGCFDDTVIGMAMAVLAIERAALAIPVLRPGSSERHKDPFTLDGIIDELYRRGNTYPIDASKQLSCESYLYH